MLGQALVYFLKEIFFTTFNSVRNVFLFAYVSQRREHNERVNWQDFRSSGVETKSLHLSFSSSVFGYLDDGFADEFINSIIN